MKWARWAAATCLMALPARAESAAPEVPPAAERLVWPGAVSSLTAKLKADDVEVRRAAAGELGRLPRAVQRRVLPGLFSDPDVEVRLAAADAALALRLPGAGERVTPWLSDPDACVRAAAAEVLTVLRDEDSVPGLGRALEDADASVRAAAAVALGNSGSRDATSFLLGHLDDTDPEVRYSVIGALEDLGDARAVVPLIGRIQEQRAALRQQAALALGALGDARAVGALIVASSDADAGVRAAAATALGRLGAADAVWSLSTLLESEADPEVQSAAFEALGAIATPASVEALLRALALPRTSTDGVERALARAGVVALPILSRCVLSPSAAGVADVCLRALGRIGGPQASESIERALRQASVDVSSALTALGAASDPSSLPTVLEFLSSGVPAQRRAAIDAAGQLLDPEREVGLAVEPLAQALEQPQGSRLERAALLGLLGRTGSPRAAPALLEAAAAEDEYLRLVALQALGEVGPAGADGVLLGGLDGSAFPVRYTAAMALRRVGTHASIDPLLERLETASGFDRELIASALAGPLADRPSDVQLQRVLTRVATGPGPVADALIEALAHVPGARGAHALEQLLPGAGKLTRAKLAEAFGAHPESVEALRTLLGDTDAVVRANAVWALGAVGSASDLPRLSALRLETDLAVAANSVASLASLAAREGADVAEPLCAALDDDRSLVLANALAGLRQLGIQCPDPQRAAWWLEHHPNEEVRLAAAALIRSAWGHAAPGALARCAAKDVSGRVAVECAAAQRSAGGQLDEPGTAGDPITRVMVLVVNVGEREPAPRAPFALVLADGSIRSGTSDRRGAVWQASAPRGTLRLTLPGVYAD